LAATGAFAQSTATIYGVVDTGYRNVTSGDNKYSGIQNGGNSSNRLGFKGTEDIEGGMKANFVMEGDLVPNDGTAAGFKFLRQSTVGLTGGFGEVRLGRDYTPTFRVFGMVDPFGYVGVGSAGNIMGSTVVADALGATPTGSISGQAAQDQTGTFTTPDRGTERRTDASGLRAPGLVTARVTVSDPNVVRANNSFAYYTPVISGFSANVMYNTGAQNTYSLKNAGVMTAVGLNYANGPLNVAYANQATKGGTTAAAASFAALSATANAAVAATNGTDNQKYTVDFVAATYDMGVAKLGLGYRTDKLSQAGISDSLNTKATIYALTAPMGAVTLKASYITKKADMGGTGVTAGDQFAIGAQYDLSKRTALYGTYAALSNKAGFANTVGGAAASAGGVKSSGFDIGVRHSF
jgi:predicted porin